MKKYLTVFAIGGALLLTGCGGSGHTLTCSQEMEGIKMESTVYFNDAEDKVEKVVTEVTQTFDSEDEAKTAASQEDLVCSAYEECSIKQSGKKATLKYTEKNNLEEYEGKTKDDLKKEAESAGATCK